jgi:hypothetical protein
LKTDVNVPAVSIQQRGKNLVFIEILKATDEKSRIQIRKSVVIWGPGSVPKRHVSGTLLKIPTVKCFLIYFIITEI